MKKDEILKIAETIRIETYKLENAAQPTTPRSAREIMKSIAPTQLNVSSAVDLRFLGRTDVDMRRMLVREAGHRLADTIAEKLEYELVQGRNGYSQYDPMSAMAQYTAKIIAFTPYELEQYTERVINQVRG